MKGKGIQRLTRGLLVSLPLILAACGTKGGGGNENSTKEPVEQEAVGEWQETAVEEGENSPGYPEPETEAETETEKTVFGSEDGRLEEFAGLYSQRRPVDGAESFEGIWNRTDIPSSLYGRIEITGQDEEGFDFTGEFYYYSHMGIAEGRAYFVAEDTALYEYEQEFAQEGESPWQYILFEKRSEELHVLASAYSAELGFGMGVSADGEYIREEPVYTNEAVLEENFTEEELESIRQMLGQDFYQEYFVWTVQNGILSAWSCTLEEGGEGVYYEAFVPTMGGYGFELLKCEDGRLYFLSESDKVRYQTNTQGELDFPVYHISDGGEQGR
ncbi:MAG: hypothetical protein ACI4D5_07085 [Kineothrix sp.]